MIDNNQKQGGVIMTTKFIDTIDNEKIKSGIDEFLNDFPQFKQSFDNIDTNFYETLCECETKCHTYVECQSHFYDEIDEMEFNKRIERLFDNVQRKKIDMFCNRLSDYNLGIDDFESCYVVEFFIDNPHFIELIDQYHYIFDDDYWEQNENNNDIINPMHVETPDKFVKTLHDMFDKLVFIQSMYSIEKK